MSDTHEAIDVFPEAGQGGHETQSAPAQAPQVVSNFADGSGEIFSMYLKMATEDDEKMAESWKADADGILIFTGLFSAAVASLISVSIQDIRQNPQDTSSFYLANIYQTLADPSLSIPTTSPPPFSPPNYAFWVNALWFLSLVISLTCALLATLLQQWARRYLKVTPSRYTPHKRARIRAFISKGVEKLPLQRTVEILPTLLHISLFLFFAGLVVFLWNVDLSIFKLVLSWVVVCTTLYGCFTIMPIIRHDSPYHTPLSLPAWQIVTGIQLLTFELLALINCFSWQTCQRFEALAGKYGKWLVQGMQKTVEETALNSPWENDTHVFLWTFDCSDEDHELERFFSGIPGFCSSHVVRNPFPNLGEEDKYRVVWAMIRLLHRTFSSDLLPEAVKKRRAITCMKAVDPAHTPEAFGVLDEILAYKCHSYSDPLVAEIVQIVKGWDIDNEKYGLGPHDYTFIYNFSREEHRGDDAWFILASKLMGIREDDVRRYAAHGDSLSLAILIYTTRLHFSHPWKAGHALSCDAPSNHTGFCARNTLPELQREFCALWDQIVRKVQAENDAWRRDFILPYMRSVYTELHPTGPACPVRPLRRRRYRVQDDDLSSYRSRSYDEPSSYPLCDNVHVDSGSTAFAPAVPHDCGNTARDPYFPSGSSYTHSSSVHALRGEESLTEAPLRNDNISSSASRKTIDQTTTERRCTPPTPPDPVAARATRGSVDMIRLSTLELSASTPPKSRASASPPDAVYGEHNADGGAPFPDVPSSPSPIQVLPTESRSPMIAPGAPGPSRPLHSSPSDLDAAAEREGSVNPAFLKEKDDAPHISLTTREDSMADPDLLPQSSSPPPIIDVAIAVLSDSSLDAEDTVDHLPRPLRDQFDAV